MPSSTAAARLDESWVGAGGGLYARQGSAAAGLQMESTSSDIGSTRGTADSLSVGTEGHAERRQSLLGIDPRPLGIMGGPSCARDNRPPPPPTVHCNCTW